MVKLSHVAFSKDFALLDGNYSLNDTNRSVNLSINIYEEESKLQLIHKKTKHRDA